MGQEIFNSLILSVPSSPTLAMTKKANELKQQGHPIISLSAGDPDTPIPQWVKDGAIKAIQEGNNRYGSVSGVPKLKEMLIKKLAKDNEIDFYGPQNTIVGCGAKQVLFNAFFVSLRPGDEVVIPVPYWASYPAIVTLAGGKPVFAHTTKENNFKLTPEALRSALTPHTRWLLLNYPSNPTGSLYTPKELKELANVLEEYPDVWVMSDDIYENLYYGEQPFVSMLQVAPKLKDRFLIVNALSKAYSMAGWRIGYGIGNVALIQAMDKFQSQSSSHVSNIMQYAAIAAFEHDNRDFFEQQRALFKKRRDLFVEKLNTLTGFKTSLPDGAFYVFANCESLLGKEYKTDIELADGLLEKAFISSVPGTEFGVPGYIRFSYTIDIEILKEACNRLSEFTISVNK